MMMRKEADPEIDGLVFDIWHEVDVASELRLDVALTEKTARSRSFIQNLLQDGRVRVNGLTKKANYKIQQEDIVEINIPKPRELDVLPENIDIEIVYEDQDIVVVNKPQGMVVHPAPGSWSGTLVNALLYHCRTLSSINGIIRPGIVHRIDKDTSGLLVVAKNDEAHQHLALQIKDHLVDRTYRAIVHGVLPEPSGTINAPIGRDPKDRKKMGVVFKNSRDAVTHYYVLERYLQFTELQAKLETGRTHQIRVHLAYLKHPVLGDPLYGPKKNPFGLDGQVLHAESLAFIHPKTGEQRQFTAGLPEYFKEVLEKLQQIKEKGLEEPNE